MADAAVCGGGFTDAGAAGCPVSGNCHINIVLGCGAWCAYNFAWDELFHKIHNIRRTIAETYQI